MSSDRESEVVTSSSARALVDLARLASMFAWRIPLTSIQIRDISPLGTSGSVLDLKDFSVCLSALHRCILIGHVP